MSDQNGVSNMGYQHTKPRGPIAAMYASPGPAVYNLPSMVGRGGHDPRSVHTKQPAWVFGVRHGKFYDDSSPGPVHLPNMNVTRYGKDGTPVYSLYGRIEPLKGFQVPGPGSYSPEKAGESAMPPSHKFSFGSRTRLRSRDQNPGPNTYTLPSLLGKTVESDKLQGPFWSQSSRRTNGGFDQDLMNTPGPGTHKVTDPSVYKSRAPSYSLKPRTEMVGDSTRKPGPGAHNPQNVKINRRSAPSYSFGIRHSDFTAPLIVDPQE